MIQPKRAHHLTLRVSDTTRAARFLTEVLGLVEVERTDIPDARAWAAGEGGFQVHLAAAMEMPASVKSLVPHLAIEVEDIAAAREALVAAGLDFVELGTVLFVSDPDGNQFELRPAEAAAPRARS
jgi:catechol 2,3-dioxygenase-like lactoylglutathione lyase family enzyme